MLKTLKSPVKALLCLLLAASLLPPFPVFAALELARFDYTANPGAALVYATGGEQAGEASLTTDRSGMDW